eukprot:2631053-Pyramimonas_sp.AAC.1
MTLSSTALDTPMRAGISLSMSPQRELMATFCGAKNGAQKRRRLQRGDATFDAINFRSLTRTVEVAKHSKRQSYIWSENAVDVI